MLVGTRTLIKKKERRGYLTAKHGLIQELFHMGLEWNVKHSIAYHVVVNYLTLEDDLRPVLGSVAH